jgi:hypothetical protein
MRSRSPGTGTVGGEAIDIEALFRSAEIISGSFDTLDEELRDRVTKLVAWVNDQAPMQPERREEVELQLRKLLVTRLRLSADRKRLPAIAEEHIERPIFVVGFARTGTTLIHSLLAEDPNSRAPLWWHTHDPSPPPGEVPVVSERIEYAARDLDRLIAQTPGLLTMHPIGTSAATV